jgi:hypothetical protein
VYEFPALELLLMHPGIRLPDAWKVTLPATEATTVMVLAVLNIRSPGANEMVADVKPWLTVTLALLDELAVR